MIHAKAMAVVVAYDMYKEAAEGKLFTDWEVEKPVSFYRFREKLAKQQLRYTPRDHIYLGDEKFRAATEVPKAKRPQANKMNKRVVNDDYTTTSGVSAGVLQEDNTEVRLCGFIGDLEKHYSATNTMGNGKKRLVCAFCGKEAYQWCSICKRAMHKFPTKADNSSISCFFRYHNTACFGLARDDWRVTGKRKSDWNYPTEATMEENESQMRRLNDNVLQRKATNVGSNNNNKRNSQKHTASGNKDVTELLDSSSSSSDEDD